MGAGRLTLQSLRMSLLSDPLSTVGKANDMDGYDYSGQEISLAELQQHDAENNWWERESDAPIKTPAEIKEFEYSTGKLSETVGRVEHIMMEHDVQFFDRGGNLVRAIIEDVSASEGRELKSAKLTPVTLPYMTKELSRIMNWTVTKQVKKEFINVPIDPPPLVSSTVLADAGDWPFHKISGIITAPTLRRDGTILWREGYDPSTKLLLLSPPEMPYMPQNPTRDDALESIKRLDKLFDGFPFADSVGRSVALSGMITPIARAAMTVAPLHVISAPSAGSGKSFLVDLCVALMTGNTAPATPIGKTEDETEKRLSSSMMQGSPIIVLDNVNGQLYGDALCQCVERPLVKFRVLGESRMMEIENKSTIFATGNNISLVDDMTRRSILCNLDSNMERPELRQFDFDPLAEILDNRGKYIADALTVVRAYKLAGSPNKLPKLASFGEWSDLIRSALVWLGYEDPLSSMDKVRDADGRLDSLRAFVFAWYTAMPGSSKTAADIVEASLANTELQVAMKSFCNPRGQMDGVILGNKLRSVNGRVVDGFKIIAEKDPHTKINKWTLQKVGEF